MFKKNNKKVVINIFILFFFSIFFLGCNDNSKENDKYKGKIRIRVWESYSPDESVVFNEIARKFEEKNPNIVVSVYKLPWTGQEAKYRTSLIGGEAPDIGRVNTSFMIELTENSAVHDVYEFGFKDVEHEYNKAALESNLIDNKCYGIPDQVTGVALFYNKDHFKEAGLDPNKPPVTWDEFVDYGKKLTNKDKKRFGFALSNSLWWHYPILGSFGGSFFDKEKTVCVLNNNLGKNAFKFITDLYRVHEIEGGAWQSGGIPAETGFINGMYSMIFMGPWNYQKFLNSDMNFGVAFIPKKSENSQTATNMGGSNMVIFKDSKHPKEAYEFLRFLTSKEMQALWANRLGQVPVNLTSYDLVDTKGKEGLEIFMQQLKYAVPTPNVKNYSEVERIFNAEFELILSGKKDINKGLDDAVNAINRKVLKVKY